jgi:hypothetical protein
MMTAKHKNGFRTQRTWGHFVKSSEPLAWTMLFPALIPITLNYIQKQSFLLLSTVGSYEVREQLR